MAQKGEEIIRRPKKGETYGNWLILGDAPDQVRLNKRGYEIRIRMYRCRCKCGTEKDVRIYSLVSGTSRSCFPCAYKKNGENLRKYDLKERYGQWKVRYIYKCIKQNLFCECECDCGYITFVKCNYLRSGESTMCVHCYHDLNVARLKNRWKENYKVMKECL